MFQDIEASLDGLQDDVDDLIEDAHREENVVQSNYERDGERLEMTEAEIAAALGDGKSIKAVKRTRAMIPKLDASRVTGQRGIGVLSKQFECVRFKGRGHEIEDLNTLMFGLEQWAHRLMPSMKFDEVLLRLEALGSKRPVQTYLNKMRQGLPLMDDDFVLRKENDLGERADQISNGSKELDNQWSPVRDEASLDASSAYGVSISQPGLTQEQRERAETNRLRALQLRAQRLQTLSTDPLQSSQDDRADDSWTPSRMRDDVGVSVEDISLRADDVRKDVGASVEPQFLTEDEILDELDM